MATWASFTTIDDALTHHTLALLGLEHVKMKGSNVVPRYIGLREVPGAQPPDAVLGVCARGGAACLGHRLPLHAAMQTWTCCVKCGARVGSCGTPFTRASGAAYGVRTPDGWVCDGTCRAVAPAPPLPDDWSRPKFGVFDDVETAAADERVRVALGLSRSMCGGRPMRTRWIGLCYEAQTDGSRLVVGVCRAHNTARGCPGHAVALRSVNDSVLRRVWLGSGDDPNREASR